jgi:hypothetical protein
LDVDYRANTVGWRVGKGVRGKSWQRQRCEEKRKQELFHGLKNEVVLCLLFALFGVRVRTLFVDFPEISIEWGYCLFAFL